MKLILTIIFILYSTSLLSADPLSYRLDNGLQVYLLPDPSSPLVSVRTMVKAGSITEEPWLGSGISHYLEHVVAGGSTEMKSEDDYTANIARFGGAFNAYTTFDHTSYYLNTTRKHVTDAISTLYEWMFHCRFDDKEVTREKGVIHKEMERSAANPSRVHYFKAQENVYKSSPFQYPIIGYKQRFDTLTRDQLVEYYNAYYVPSNMALIVGGDFDIAMVKLAIEKTFGTTSYVASPKIQTFIEPKAIVQRTLVSQAKTTFTTVSMRFLTTDIASPDLYPLDLLAYILGHGRESMLYRLLVTQKKLAHSVSSMSYTPINATGFFDITFESESENIESCINEVNKTIAQIRKKQIPMDYIHKAIKQKLAEEQLAGKSIDARVSQIGRSHLIDGSPSFDANYAQAFKSVKQPDLVKVANTYLNKESQIITISKPEVVTNNSQTKITPIVATINNQLTVMMFPDPDARYTAAEVTILHGVRNETERTNGVGVLASRLLGRERNGLMKKAEAMGARTGMSVGFDFTTASLESTPDQFDYLFKLFLTTIQKPKINKDTFNQERQLHINAILKRDESWASEAFYKVRADFFSGHPYRRPAFGEKSTIQALSIADIEHYFDTLNQHQQVLTITGQFDPDAILSRLRKKPCCGSQFRSGRVTFKRAKKDQESEKELSLKQPVSAIVVAVDGVSFTTINDQVHADLLDTVLGGMNYPGGRLHPLLRGKEAVYVVHSQNRSHYDDGYFLVYALTSPDKVDLVKSDIIDTMTQLTEIEISDEELNIAKAQVRYAYLEQIGTLPQRASQLAKAYLLGQPATVIDTKLQILEELTASDVKQMAMKRFKNSQIYIFNKR